MPPSKSVVTIVDVMHVGDRGYAEVHAISLQLPFPGGLCVSILFGTSPRALIVFNGLHEGAVDGRHVKVVERLFRCVERVPHPAALLAGRAVGGHVRGNVGHLARACHGVDSSQHGRRLRALAPIDPIATEGEGASRGDIRVDFESNDAIELTGEGRVTCWAHEYVIKAMPAEQLNWRGIAAAEDMVLICCLSPAIAGYDRFGRRQRRRDQRTDVGHDSISIGLVASSHSPRY